MSLFFHVLADIILFINMLILCDMYFVFQTRNAKYNKAFIGISSGLVCAISIFIYLFDMDVIESLIYLITMVSVVFILYKENFFRVVIVVFWMLLALSMMDTMLYFDISPAEFFTFDLISHTES